jgi:hypothetical protein
MIFGTAFCCTGLVYIGRGVFGADCGDTGIAIGKREALMICVDCG